MFIKRTTRRVGPKTYVNHLLVESVATPAGPRHRTICSLGSLAPGPIEEWQEPRAQTLGRVGRPDDARA